MFTTLNRNCVKSNLKTLGLDCCSGWTSRDSLPYLYSEQWKFCSATDEWGFRRLKRSHHTSIMLTLWTIDTGSFSRCGRMNTNGNAKSNLYCLLYSKQILNLLRTKKVKSSYLRTYYSSSK
jgi:hypothetical protein